jgi:hypothetical protein
MSTSDPPPKVPAASGIVNQQIAGINNARRHFVRGVKALDEATRSGRDSQSCCHKLSGFYDKFDEVNEGVRGTAYISSICIGIDFALIMTGVCWKRMTGVIYAYIRIGLHTTSSHSI